MLSDPSPSSTPVGSSVKTKIPRNKTAPLNPCFSPDNRWEIGVDEAGRGPLFGRLYVAGAILPKDNFRHDWMKDSKRFSSEKKIREVADYIKNNATAWTVQYAEAELIDEINIRQAVLKTMRECCRELITQIKSKFSNEEEPVNPARDFCLLIDGCDFPAYTVFDETSQTIVEVESHTIEGGDNLFSCIAAASILAKVERDKWIQDLCAEFPSLDEWYGLLGNKGYGTRKHMDGIELHGITVWHRKSYGPCKDRPMVDVEPVK